MISRRGVVMKEEESMLGNKEQDPESSTGNS